MGRVGAARSGVLGYCPRFYKTKSCEGRNSELLQPHLFTITAFARQHTTTTNSFFDTTRPPTFLNSFKYTAMPSLYSIAEDAELIRLKERVPFAGWSALAAAWNQAFPLSPRPWGTLQVRYSRYLQAGKPHRARALAHLAAATAGMLTFYSIHHESLSQN